MLGRLRGRDLHAPPAPELTAALILSGTGYNPSKEFAHRRIKAYKERGIDYRWDYTFEDFSPAFRATPMARFFADMFAERNPRADLQTIIHQFEAPARRIPRITIRGSHARPSFSAAARTPPIKARSP